MKNNTLTLNQLRSLEHLLKVLKNMSVYSDYYMTYATKTNIVDSVDSYKGIDTYSSGWTTYYDLHDILIFKKDVGIG